MKIIQGNTAAIIIDIQEKLLPHMYESDRMLGNCLKLTEGLQHLSIPLLVTQQYTKGLGNTVPQLIDKIHDFRYIEKMSFSCFMDPVFKMELLKLNKQNIVIYGIESHICVLQTCIDLLSEGFIPFVVEDCVSSRKQNDKNISIERMRQEGARISTTESVLFELTGKSGTDLFKKISGIIK
jgi:nicotinamidase-related amidase